MDLKLRDLKVAVAGSSRGLGFAIAKTFSQEKAQVWLSGRNEPDLRNSAETIENSHFTVCDLESRTGREKFFHEIREKWEFPDILVLNIGSGRSDYPGLDSPEEEWKRVHHLNFETHLQLIRMFKPLMSLSSHASILSISSISGHFRSAAPLSYGVAKAALNSLCVLAAKELAQHRIRYNVVSPGNILTPGGRWEERRNANPEQVDSYIRENVPLQRFATPEEIAAWVAFIASPIASFSTGAITRVDGGQVGALG